MKNIIADVKSIFVERDEEIDAIGRAILARQHVAMLGAPGIAKSALVREFCSRIIGAKYFQRLLRRDSTTDEVFGPVSLKGLEQDSYRRNISGKLPEAHLGFGDEGFKCNSTLLNGLLDIINERTFENDGAQVKCPLWSFFVASNELPQSEDLAPFWDRLLVRIVVRDIQEDSAFLRFLEAKSGRGMAALAGPWITVPLAEIERQQAETAAVDIPTDVNQQIVRLRRDLHAEGIRPSPRRFAACLEYLKAAAYLDGRNEVAVDDIPVLADCLWEKPDQLPKLAQILGQLASPELGRVMEIFDAAKEAADKALAGKDAQVLLESNSKLQKAYKELDKIAKSASGKAKGKAEAAMKQIKGWNAEILKGIGIATL